MLPRVHTRGKRTYGLLAYLFGPGKHEEHTDPHLVASFDGMAPDPGRDPNATYRQLQQLLDQPVNNIEPDRRPTKHVWHLSVRNAPEDRILSDDEWADVARRMVAATGIDDPDDGAGCRWAAVRHADDHIHIIATLVREDGYKPDLDYDANRAQDEARVLEAELGLRRLRPGDGTAAKRPTSPERHKAQRHHREQTPREELRETVRRAVAGADTEEEFFARLRAAGLLIRTRAAPSGDLLGYNVALPGDRNKDDQPIWFPGSKLAPDLSLPRIRQRLTGPRTGTDDQSQTDLPAAPARARRAATKAASRALDDFDTADDGTLAAQIAATGEALDALATTTAPPTRHEIRTAARAFERASRSHVRAQHRQARQLRRAARDLIYGGPALGHGEDGAATAMVIDTLFFLVIAASHWHAERHHAQQAAAAQEAAHHLRAAYNISSGPPLGALRARGRALPRAVRERHHATVRSALPHIADRVLVEPGSYALAATLAEAEAHGHDPHTVLAHAAAQRELTTAESVSDVLVWRIRRNTDLPAHPRPTPGAEQRAANRTHRSPRHQRGPGR